MRWLLPLLVVVACTSSAPPRAPSLAPRACVALSVAQNQQQSALARNRQALLDAIAARGLARVTLPATKVHPTQQSFEWRVEGTQLLAPISEETCGNLPPEDGEFVRNPAGELWALLPAPAVRSQQDIATCACASQLPPSRCGGAALAPLQLAYQLPAGVTFRGKLPIEYPVDVVSISYADYRADVSHCPPMPPPPP